MTIKELRQKANLTQREFGERLCVQSQTILKYEKEERKVPESIQKLIRYEFAEYLPEEERLIAKVAGPGDSEENPEVGRLLEENAVLQDQVREIPHLKEQNILLKRTVELLEDQVQLYKDKLTMTTSKGKTA